MLPPPLGPLLAFRLLVGMPGCCAPQDTLPPAHASGIPRWATVSLGVGTPPRTALLLSVSLQTRPALLSLRLAGNFAAGDGPTESDLALLAMHATPGRSLRAVVGAGIALVTVDDGSRGFYRPINRHTLAGLPLEAQGLWCLSRELGLGLTGFADLNGRRSFAGITLGLVWGTFWAAGTTAGLAQ